MPVKVRVKDGVTVYEPMGVCVRVLEIVAVNVRVASCSFIVDTIAGVPFQFSILPVFDQFKPGDDGEVICKYTRASTHPEKPGGWKFTVSVVIVPVFDPPILLIPAAGLDV